MLVFDVFGVLITEGHLISNGLMHLLPAGTDKATVKANYENYNVGCISESEFWKNIGQSENDALRSEFLSIFQLVPNFDVIQQLKPHYRLAILSNFPPDWAIALTDKFGFKDLFEPIVFSGTVGCKKPHPDIYNILIEKSGLESNQIAFIDDRLENLKTAHDLGMATIYYQRESDPHSYQPDRTIVNLGELETLLNSV